MKNQRSHPKKNSPKIMKKVLLFFQIQQEMNYCIKKAKLTKILKEKVLFNHLPFFHERDNYVKI